MKRLRTFTVFGRRVSFTGAGVALRIAMVIAGGFIALKAAPDIEMLFFPVLTDIYQVPDPDDPNVQTDVNGSLVCWWLHLHKARDVEVIRRSIAVLMPDGSRYFAEPIDSRTGLPFNSRDAKPVGFTGVIRSCAKMPDGFDFRAPFQIENFSQYRPRHGLWLLDQPYTTIKVAPIAGSEQ